MKNLEQVIITAEKPRYLRVTGYFLSYQLIDNKAQSFADGMIEYYIDLKRNKLKKYNIKSSRLFKNTDYLQELKRNKPKVTNLLGTNILPFSFDEEVMLNEWEDKDVEFREILDGSEVGTVQRGGNKSELTIEYHTPENPRTISLLGLKTSVDHHLVREEFKSNNPNIEKLGSVSKYYSSQMKKKGEEIDYELEQDFFVSKIEYLNKEQFTSATEELNHEVISHFSSDFWKDYQDNIPPGIKNVLYNNMELIEM
ncbi:hypothetical protein RM553_18945 [Zunongwangia sp. F363]|uniref:Uncharacterized protein n=1 Tax=Autumnicola tepida TaxID=3075595 RepID=A0ABU3CF96_9FLAO|nr:hypothetical protein [Zunongwangia sp. F363]MDT0644923.1 hypothetical protein [Zunongwangia sp. F363]